MNSRGLFSSLAQGAAHKATRSGCRVVEPTVSITSIAPRNPTSTWVAAHTPLKREAPHFAPARVGLIVRMR